MLVLWQKLHTVYVLYLHMGYQQASHRLAKVLVAVANGYILFVVEVLSQVSFLFFGSLKYVYQNRLSTRQA